MTSSAPSSYLGSMEGEGMSLKLVRTLNPPSADEDPGLNIAVIFTSIGATVAAMAKAGTLAEDLGARITLVIPQVVPFPLPLESPPVLLDFQESRFRDIAANSPVEVQVQLYLCRDGLE